MVSITCYGGVGEIGGNKLLVNFGESSLFLDFGFSFGAEGQFFEEYLQPRSTTKLHDLLELGLLPELDGIYRRDALRPDGFDEVADDPASSLWDREIQSYEEAAASDDWTPDAIFLSHAHLDHAGYVPFLGDVPIVYSETTETLLESIAEIGNLQGFDSEFRELERRNLGEYGGGYFPGAYKITRDDSDPRPATTLSHGEETTVGTGEVSIRLFSVGHSIPGAMAAVIESDDEQVLYTGDLRFHGRSGHDLGETLRGLRPDVMLCEGTRILEDEPDDEERVEDELTSAIDDAEGLAMVGFSWKDLERYETVRQAAHRKDRTPVFDPRCAYLKARLGESIYDEGARAFVERSGSMLYSPGDYTRGKHKAGEMPISEWDSRGGVTDTKHLDEGVTAVDINRNPSEYVLHLDYYRFQNLIDLDVPEGSVYVRAQTEPFNDEMELSEDRLTNWLECFGINADRDHEPIQIHASGHAAGPEIREMIDKIEPRTLVPIHTEHPEAFENPHGDIVEPSIGSEFSV
jgi:ribonuclease J